MLLSCAVALYFFCSLSLGRQQQSNDCSYTTCNFSQIPISVNALADGIVVFNCSANAEFINWEVEGSEPINTGIIQSKTTKNFERCLKVRSLTINASSVCYNISNIRCFVYTISCSSEQCQCDNLSEPPAAYNVFGKNVMTMVTVTTALYESKTVTAVSTNNQDISLTSTIIHTSTSPPTIILSTTSWTSVTPPPTTPPTTSFPFAGNIIAIVVATTLILNIAVCTICIVFAVVHKKTNHLSRTVQEVITLS